jgi:hypothetical protein
VTGVRTWLIERRSDTSQQLRPQVVPYGGRTNAAEMCNRDLLDAVLERHGWTDDQVAQAVGVEPDRNPPEERGESGKPQLITRPGSAEKWVLSRENVDTRLSGTIYSTQDSRVRLPPRPRPISAGQTLMRPWRGALVGG